MKKEKLIGLVLGIILFVVAIAGITYAFVFWTSDNINNVVSSKCFNVLYDNGTDLIGNLVPSDDYTGGLSVTVKMDISSDCDIDARGKLYLNTSEDTSSNLLNRPGLLNYQVLFGNRVTNIRGSITSTGDIEIDLGDLSKNTVATSSYTVYVWLDNDLIENSDNNSVYYGSIRSEAVQYKYE